MVRWDGGSLDGAKPPTTRASLAARREARDVKGESSPPKTHSDVYLPHHKQAQTAPCGSIGQARALPLLDPLLGALVAMEPRRSIPNSAVKHCKGDNTPWVTGREDSLVPRRSKQLPLMVDLIEIKTIETSTRVDMRWTLTRESSAFSFPDIGDS